MTVPKPPRAFEDFTTKYPKLAEAWDKIGEAGREGPLDERISRLVKLGVAIGALREGAIRASVRKAIAGGIPRPEIDQVVALAAGTLGLPSTVAVHSWIEEALAGKPRRA